MRKMTPLFVLILAACGGQRFTADSTAGTGGAEVPAGGSAGMGNAGAGDAGDGAGGSGGGNGGLSGGDSGGSSGSIGSAGSGTGGAGAPTCPQLFSRAKSELDAASVCDDSAKAQQCTGTVTNTCGCKVPIEKNEPSRSPGISLNAWADQAKELSPELPVDRLRIRSQVLSATCPAEATTTWVFAPTACREQNTGIYPSRSVVVLSQRTEKLRHPPLLVQRYV